MDSFKHKGLRRKLIEEIKGKGVVSPPVLNAMGVVPRHLFIPDTAFHEYAYVDKAFPIGADQTISQPYTVGFQTQLLEIVEGDKVLEVGTGSGYQTAVLCEMKAKVFSIERQKSLFKRTKPMLSQMGYKAKCFYGDGYAGLPAFAPFDKILVTAGAPFIPEQLKLQLVVGGILVIPVGAGDVQIMNYVKRISETEYEHRELGEFKFVPMLTDKEWKKV